MTKEQVISVLNRMQEQDRAKELPLTEEEWVAIYSATRHLNDDIQQPEGLDEAKSKYWNYTGCGITDFAAFKKAADFFYRQGCIDTEDKIRNAKQEDFGEISCQSVGLDEAAEEYARQYTENDNGNGGDDWEDDIRITFEAGAKWMAVQGESEEDILKGDEDGRPIIRLKYSLRHLSDKFKAGDKVIVQIRKAD